MATPTLIYCAGGNKRFAEIAINAGFEYGSQLPETVYFPLYMADQDWKKPNRKAYMTALEIHRPHIASVLDWERKEQISEVLSWAEEAAQYSQIIMIIPKVQGGIKQLPRRIGNSEIRLGFSVPTRFGGTSLHVAEFENWPVHLLGGSPHSQMNYAHYLRVESADGNYAAKMARQYCQFWATNDRRGSNRHWPKIIEVDGKRWETDGIYEAFRRSCENIMAAWSKIAS